MENNKTLNFVLTSINEPISLNPFKSDNFANQTYMASLVGTLVKRGAQGRYQPYLAQEWSTNDFIHWSFKIRNDIQTENGEQITATSYKKSLETVIKIYHKKRPNLPIIEEIVGFNEFVIGKAQYLDGLQVENNNLVIIFKKPINSGVLEFLSMPYYGYYSENNFNNGAWSDDYKIISSGSHVVDSIEKEKSTITLRKKDSWFSLVVGAVSKIKIQQVPYEDSFKVVGPKLIGTNGVVDPELMSKNNLSVSVGAPEILIAFKLNVKSGFFTSVINRRIFLSKLREAQKYIKLEGEGLTFSDYFYPFFKTPIVENVDSQLSFEYPVNKVSMIIPTSASSKRPEYLRKIVESAFNGSKVQLDFKTSVPGGQLKDSVADIKAVVVSIGSGFQHWLTKMMFCSDLGVSFEDPENQICKLVSEFDGLNWDINEFSRKFNQILHDQAATIPLYHNSYKWIVDGVDVELSPISLIPRFDLMKLK